MSKTKKARVSPVGTIVILVGIVIAIIGIVCMSTTALCLTIKAGGETQVGDLITGFGLAFGAPYDVKIGDFTYTAQAEMNTTVLIFFIVLALGRIIAMLLRVMKQKKISTAVGLLGGLLAIVGGVLFFFVPNFVGEDLINSVDAFNKILGLLGGSAALTHQFGRCVQQDSRHPRRERRPHSWAWIHHTGHRRHPRRSRDRRRQHHPLSSRITPQLPYTGELFYRVLSPTLTLGTVTKL